MAEKSQNSGDWRILFENEAKLRGFSIRTITNYAYYINRFIDSKKAPGEYLLHLILQ